MSVAAGLLLTGCFKVGPGAMASYTIQPQPAAGSCHYRYVDAVYPLPDPSCTPGAASPQVTQANIAQTICASGYTARVRPPESITEAEKQGSAAAYGYTGRFSTGEYDHLIALELGGDPNDPANLWVEPNDDPNATNTSNTKDVLENKLNQLVCSGQVTLFQAQLAISSDWVTAYETYVGPLPIQATSSPGPGGAPFCQATASAANDGYSGDFDVSITSNQPDRTATASDANDTWSDPTDGSGSVVIRLYFTSPGELISVTVGGASCSTAA
ncbi:MAG: hypothetical protein ACRDYB_08670 [Acidimicrobiales bacterium]